MLRPYNALMLIPADQSLKTCGGSWIARRAGEFPVVNVHVVDVAAPPERVFAALEDRVAVAPRWHWRALLVFRAALGRVFNWDEGIEWDRRAGPLVPGSSYAFFRIEHVEQGRELGLSVENKLTRALVSFVIVPAANGSRVFNVTCALFKGRLGRAYWHVIHPFHDGITEDWLDAVRRRAESNR